MRKHYKVFIFVAILLVFVSAGSVLFFSLLTAPNILIEVGSDGRLYAKADADTENMYICWETDAGSIKPVEVNEDLKYQPDNAYFCYTAADEAVLWEEKDYDGNDYSTVTIRAYLYKRKDESTAYYSEKALGSNEITIEKSGKIVKLSEKRIFGNPVRTNRQNDWSQIIPIYDHPSVVLMRYRTGAAINKNESIQWESQQPLLCRFEFNGLPLASIASIKGSNKLKKADNAFLYFEAYRNTMEGNYNHGTNETAITVKAFIYDKSLKMNKHESSITYLYNDVKKEYKELG